MAKIGICGLGQAGTRLAIAVANLHPDDEIVVVDPPVAAGKAPSLHQYGMKLTTVIASDDEFFSTNFDRMVVAVDPISLMGEEVNPAIRRGPGTHPKHMYLKDYAYKDIPLLLERPRGWASNPNILSRTFPSPTWQSSITVFIPHCLSYLHRNLSTKFGK